MSRDLVVFGRIASTCRQAMQAELSAKAGHILEPHGESTAEFLTYNSEIVYVDRSFWYNPSPVSVGTEYGRGRRT